MEWVQVWVSVLVLVFGSVGGVVSCLVWLAGRLCDGLFKDGL